MKRSLADQPVNGLITIAAICAALSLSALLSRHHVLFDIVSHFRVQYVVLLLPIVLLAIVRKRILTTLLLIIVMTIHGHAVAMSLWPESPNRTEKHADLRIINTNLRYTNLKHKDYLQQIQALRPDVIALQEYSHEWHQSLTVGLSDYSYRITQPESGAFGIALFSRYPISTGSVRYFGYSIAPSVDAEIDIDGHRVRIIVVHPPPPMSSTLFRSRNEQMRSIAAAAEAYPSSLIVAGDFNATPWTAHFSDMERLGRLRSARKGFGVHPSWPNGLFLLKVPIDHILVDKLTEVLTFESATTHGSDHRSVWSDLRIFF